MKAGGTEIAWHVVDSWKLATCLPRYRDGRLVFLQTLAGLADRKARSWRIGCEPANSFPQRRVRFISTCRRIQWRPTGPALSLQNPPCCIPGGRHRGRCSRRLGVNQTASHGKAKEPTVTDRLGQTDNRETRRSETENPPSMTYARQARGARQAQCFSFPRVQSALPDQSVGRAGSGTRDVPASFFSVPFADVPAIGWA